VVAEDPTAEGHHLAAVDVVIDGEVPQRRDDAWPRVVDVAHHLHRDAHPLVVGVRSPHEQGRVLLALGHQEHRRAEALAGLPVRPGRQRHPGDVAGARHVEGLLGGGQQVGQAERSTVPVAGHADQMVGPAGLGQPRVQGRLHVDVLVAGPVRLGDRQPVDGDAEVLADDHVEAGPLAFTRGRDEAAHQATAVAADVRELGRTVGCGTRRLARSGRQRHPRGHGQRVGRVRNARPWHLPC
jgi:hypothetical protein